jgi:hypothetical protein
VVSKEEVAVGKKGSGGAWGSTSRNAGLAGISQWISGSASGSVVEGKVRKNNKKQNRAEVENSFLKRKQRAGSKVGGKKQRQKIYLEGIDRNPRSYIKLEIYMYVRTCAC